MLIDRPQIVEGSSIQNATVASGTTPPASPSIGELFYNTTLGQLQTYGGSAWVAVTNATAFGSHLADDTLHLTAAQNTLLDGVVATLTSAELNYVDGVTSAIQPQLNSKLPLAGGAMTGAIAMGSQKITGLGVPTAGGDAANLTFVEQEISRSVPLGLEGQVPFIVTDGSRTSEQDHLVRIGQFIETDQELAEAQLRIVSGATIFNEWYRFSHFTTTPGTATRSGNVATIVWTVPNGIGAGQQVTLQSFTDTSFNGVYTVLSVPTTTSFTVSSVGPNVVTAVSGTVNCSPHQPGLALELQGWSYDQVTDTVSSTINSSSTIGFISPKKYSAYEHEVRLTSTNGDDDMIGVVIAWHVDATGREHTLSATRSTGGAPTWRIMYNTGRADQQTIADRTVNIAWGNGSFGATSTAAGYVSNQVLGGWDDFPLGTLVRVVRAGDIITIDTTQLGSTAYVPAAQVVLDLNSVTQTVLNQFRGPKAYGYMSNSQAASNFKILKFSDSANAIYDIRNGNAYKFISGAWTLDGSTNLTADIGVGRFVFDRYTEKTFFVDPTLGVTKITTNYDSVNALETDIASLTTSFNTHTADQALHLTTQQNTFIDGINYAAIGASDVNRLNGLDGFLGGSTALATYLSNLNANKLNRDGTQAMTGALGMGGFRITALGAPVNATDAVTKDYVDQLQQGLSWKDSVQVATTVNITLSGTQTIDGVAVGVNARVLVKNQTNQAENGVYLVATGAWSRAADANSANELDGMAVFVRQGTAHQDTAWIQTRTLATFPGDAIIFSQFSAAGGATAGQGILIAGSTISARVGNGLTFSGQDIVLNVSGAFSLGTQLDLSTTGVTAGTYRSVTVNTQGRVTGGTNPTTLAGYGITDAVNTSGTNATGTWPISITGSAADSASLGGVAAGSYSRSNGATQFSIGPANGGADTAAVVTGRNAPRFGNGVTTYSTYNSAGSATAYTEVLSFGHGLGGHAEMAVSWSGTPALYIRSLRDTTDPWTAWTTMLSSANYNTYSPTLGGVGATGTWPISITGSAASAATAGSAGSVAWANVSGKPVQSDWSTVGSISNVVGLLSWKNYGNNHVIFDASAGTAPSGAAISNSVPQVAWGSTYPTLMGWNGAQTYGVKVNRADLADNASALGGFTSSVTVANNTIVRRDENGYLFANYLNSTDNSVSSGVTSVMVKAGDSYLRSGSAAAIAAFINGQNFSIGGSSASATLAAKASTLASSGGNGTAMTFNWSGQSGQPTWLWGGNDGSNMYVYNPSNFSVNYATTAGNVSSISSAVGNAYTWTGGQAFSSTANTSVATSSSTLQPTATSTGVGATISFHRPGVYGLNMGLDSDNVFRIGGWSAGASRLSLDMAGNLVIPGQMTAPQYSGSVTGSYGSITVGGSTGGYSGIVLTNVLSQFPVIGMFDSSGNGGTWDPAGSWHTYWNRSNACLAIGGSTTTTGYKLHVNGSARADGAIIANGGELYSNNSFRLQTSSPTITLQDTDNLSAFLHVNSNLIYFLRGNAVNATSWDSGPGGRHPMTLDMSSGNVTFSGNVTAYSDRRLKRDIEPIYNALDKVSQLQGVSFKRLDTEDYHIGVIAQDAQKVVPEVVKEDGDGYLAVAYGNMAALLIEAIKELKAEVVALKSEVETLKAQKA